MIAAGKRYSLPNSRIMIHQPLGGAQGGQTDIDIQVISPFVNKLVSTVLILITYLHDRIDSVCCC